jgi:hypothetical protein
MLTKIVRLISGLFLNFIRFVQDVLALNQNLPHLPSRMFLYGLHLGPNGHPRSAASIGLLDYASFDIVHEYPAGTFDIWSNIHRATRGGIHWLLFLDHDGRAATGTINSDFGFVPAKTYPAGEHLEWSDAAVDGNGELLLTMGLTVGRTRVGFGQVEPDGQFIVWWHFEVELPPPVRLLGLPHAHAWLTTKTGPNPTSTVSLLHRGTVVGGRTWNESWTGMAVHGDLLAVYRGVRQFSTPKGTTTTPPHYEVCRVGRDHQITTLWNYEQFPATVDNRIGADIDTHTGSLFCEFSFGANVAEVRSLTERGFARTAALGELRQIGPGVPHSSPGWSNIAPC